ncbi:MAG: ABC transporter permease [Bacteroidota bacterium]
MQRIIFNFYLALEGVMANQLRAILTALGIIFGVSAVIAMLAIGSGAKQSILDQMKLIGTNNIVVKSIVPSNDIEGSDDANAAAGDGQGKKDKSPWSPGLTIYDALTIAELVPTVEEISPEVILPLNIVRQGKHQKGRCIGVTNTFFELNNLQIAKGTAFHYLQLDEGKPVCVIGKTIEKKFFNDGNAIGKRIKCGNVWLTVIGILEKRIAEKESLANLGIRDYNADIYVPVNTALLRLKNRALLNKGDLKENRWDDGSDKAQNYHQLDRLVVRVKDSKKLQATADIMARMLKRKHSGKVDFEIEVPELLLQQQQKTQETFNFVLAVIAGISLLVGGIGIMNIMLASVLERIKEIGVRRSLGANQQDIVFQFLFEAVFISLIGGILGIILGVVAAKTIASYADIPTVVSTWSIVLSFGVAASVGLVFGLFPAQKAAAQDPIKALRSD